MTELKVKLNPKKHSGYIICKRLNKVVYIGNAAIPSPICGFICDCGQCAKLDPYYHTVFYAGKRL